jgi:anthranilate synthase/aminodeoxychorismate synthase-like glutamine amidotransferase
MLLLIDNYDSFTYNLVHYFGELGTTPHVVRNDALTVQDALAMKPEAIVLSPGPCDPAQAGICLSLTRAAAGAGVPLFGVCLGHQTIGEAFGGRVVRHSEIVHGKLAQIRHSGPGRFRGPALPPQRPRVTTASWWSATACPTSWRSRRSWRTARSWACATGPFPSRACSSTPRASGPSTAMRF